MTTPPMRRLDLDLVRIDVDDRVRQRTPDL
jgi:hypothetical protein